MKSAAAAPFHQKHKLPHEGCFHVELLHNPYINYRRLTNRVTSSGRSIRAEADAPSRRTHGPRRRIGVEETEEKSGKQTSAEPEAENTT